MQNVYFKFLNNETFKKLLFTIENNLDNYNEFGKLKIIIFYFYFLFYFTECLDLLFYFRKCYNHKIKNQMDYHKFQLFFSRIDSFIEQGVYNYRNLVNIYFDLSSLHKPNNQVIKLIMN